MTRLSRDGKEELIVMNPTGWRDCMNVLLAVDGSEVSGRATTALIAFAARLKEMPRVQVLYVHLPIPIGLATRHIGREALDSYYREEGEAIVRPIVARLQQAGLEATPHVRVGAPGETIAHAAKEMDCDAIWLGTHGRGAVTQALLGSVATRVVALADRPVTLVR